ncbi:DUF2061 domain-containing protein [Salinimicrobium oceani]|uniref:DUF2061 domain-containing protein n=1 Tax=Salinimicrobium oceani TaxID=2722702 RepID=A0ABX1D2P8_9FLAO|nr:DUF2061 domain-containing protein [Salinimicrobium oceani]NJW53458.1 DUF2061 domain-containing protein [Salinimicrobium oceani]
MKDSSYKRHIAKTVTWRMVGTLDTILLTWLISGNPVTGLKIGFAEFITKMILYYFHERLWFKGELKITAGKWSSRKRHIAKTISWRVVGTVDTMLLAWIITGSPLTGVKIGLAEVITKMILYYLHERTWYRVDYGLPGRRRKAEEVVEVKEQVKG